MDTQLLLIRHGKTQGNLERRYIGDREEPLCEAGAREALLQRAVMPAIDCLYTGPARRCRETAEILFPGVPAKLCGLAEIDFGVFKGKNADDLLGDPAYEQWLSTSCMGDIPGGDSVTEFKARTCETFRRLAEESKPGLTALVIHGGNIMAVMERFSLPRRDFYDYHIPNCGAILCRYQDGRITVIERSGA